MKSVHSIIIGQGVAGTIVALELAKRNADFIVIDDERANTASTVAGAVLNNYNVRKRASNLSDKQNFDRAIEYYRSIDQQYGVCKLSCKQLLLLDDQSESVIFPSNSSNNVIIDEPLYILNARTWLDFFKTMFIESERYQKETFNINHLVKKHNKYIWGNYAAERIYICNGAAGRLDAILESAKWVKNKGDALIVRIPELSSQYIYQYRDLRLVPLKDDIFWLGTQHKWDFDTLTPDNVWAEHQVSLLQKILNLPFEILEHLYAERPTTSGQKPIIRSISPGIEVINGLGSKGFMRAATLIPDFVASHF